MAARWGAPHDRSMDTTAADPIPPSASAPSAPTRPDARRFTRRTDGRLLTGVAGGIADALGVDARVVRLAFVLLALFGAGGVVAYLVAWLVLPARDAQQSHGERFLARTDGAGRWIGVALVVLAVAAFGSATDAWRPDVAVALVLVGLGVVLLRDPGRPRVPVPAAGAAVPQVGPDPAVGAPLVTDDDLLRAADPLALWGLPTVEPDPAVQRARRPRSVLTRLAVGVALLAGAAVAAIGQLLGRTVEPEDVIGVVLVIVGLGLLVASVTGRAPGLIVLGVVLVPLAALTSLVDVSPAAGTGNRVEVPSAVGDGGLAYDLWGGSLTVDLRDLADERGTIDVTAHVGTGELRVLVPEGARVEARGRAGAGEVVVLGEVDAGTGAEQRVVSALTAGTEATGDAVMPLFRIDARVGLGEVVVERAPLR